MYSLAALRYLFALSLYGTIGLFLHFISYSSEFVVLCRGSIGTLFILLVLFLRRKKIDYAAIRKNLKYLLISGFALGFNWVFLFAGYRYGIAVTSLCNYLAPVIVVIISSLIYKEAISRRQIFCIIAAFIGMILLLGIFENEAAPDYHCVVYGLLAAFGFVILVLCNRRLTGIDALEKTAAQLFFSVLIVLPYVIFNDGFPKTYDQVSTILVIILGVLHTGVAYICYFSSINILSAQSIAVMGYLEPALNLLLGALVLKENIALSGYIGAIMIIGASIVNEVFSDD